MVTTNNNRRAGRPARSCVFWRRAQTWNKLDFRRRQREETIRLRHATCQTVFTQSNSRDGPAPPLAGGPPRTLIGPNSQGLGKLYVDRPSVENGTVRPGPGRLDGRAFGAQPEPLGKMLITTIAMIIGSDAHTNQIEFTSLCGRVGLEACRRADFRAHKTWHTHRHTHTDTRAEYIIYN